MSHRVLIGGFLALLAVAAVSGQGSSAAAPQRRLGGPASAPPAPVNAAAPRAVLDKYCVGCHNARLKTGGLALDELDLSRLADHAEVAEKVALKLRAGMMPPPRCASTRSGHARRAHHLDGSTSWTAMPSPAWLRPGFTVSIGPSIRTSFAISSG